MIKLEKIILKKGTYPVLNKNCLVKEAIDVMNKYKLGSVCVIDNNEKFKGIITDGDIRRKLVNYQKPFPEFMNTEINNFYSKKTITTKKKNLNVKNLIKKMNSKKIWDLPVVNSKNKLLGVIHLQNLLKYAIKKIK